MRVSINKKDRAALELFMDPVKFKRLMDYYDFIKRKVDSKLPALGKKASERVALKVANEGLKQLKKILNSSELAKNFRLVYVDTYWASFEWKFPDNFGEEYVNFTLVEKL